LTRRPPYARAEKRGSPKDAMIGALALLRSNGPVFMAAGLGVGLALPALAALLRPTLPLLVFLLTIATFLSVDWRAVRVQARRPVLLALIALALLLATPVIA